MPLSLEDFAVETLDLAVTVKKKRVSLVFRFVLGVRDDSYLEGLFIVIIKSNKINLINHHYSLIVCSSKGSTSLTTDWFFNGD